MRVALLTLVLAAGGAQADDADARKVTTAAEPPPRTWVDFRLGATTTESWGQVCAGVFPFPVMGLEACGNGSGFLHQADAPEIAHFRGKLRLHELKLGPAYLSPWLGLGFAELQVAPDAPGFDFFGSGPTGAETAGAEVGGALRAAVPLAAGFELVGNIDLSLAYFPAAPTLVRPMSPWQPTLSADIGIGF